MKKRDLKSNGDGNPPDPARAKAVAVPEPIRSQSAGVPVGGILTRGDVWLLVLITLGGFLLRLYRLDFREANLDESYNMRIVRTPLWRDFFSALLTVDCHPPINYLIQKFFYWIRPTLASVRLVSVIFGTAVIPALFWAFRPLLGKRVAFAASFLAATSYILVWYSRVARNYALFFAISVLMFGFFTRLLKSETKRESTRNLWGFSISSIVGLYVHHTTLLMLPIFATLYVIWECWHRRFRRPLFVHLVLVGLALLVFSIPILYQLNAWSFDHFASQRIRPDGDQLMGLLGSVGWGGGWRVALWALALLIGCFAIVRRSGLMGSVFACWVLFPFVVYLMLVGMPQKFVWYFFRYALFIQIGLLALVASCSIYLAERMDALRLAGRRWFPFALVILLLVAGRLVVLWKPYSIYYEMKASKHSRKQIIGALRSVPFKRVLADNFYYVTGGLREFKPDDIKVAYPPVFNNLDDYARFGVAGFVRESCEKDPLLGYFGTGARFGYAQTNMTWEWLNQHFTRKTRMVNKEGYELARMGLNYFTFLSIDPYFRFCFYYNTMEDLPAWYARKGETLGTGFAEGWHPVSLFVQPAWKMWYCMEQEATFYVYNAGPPEAATLSFDVQACAPVQHLNVFQETNRVFDLDLKMPAVVLHAINGEPPVRAYVSFSRLLQSNEGVMPYFAGFVFSYGHAVTLSFRVPHGLSFLSLRSSDKEGLLMSNLTIAREAHPEAASPVGREGRAAP